VVNNMTQDKTKTPNKWDGSKPKLLVVIVFVLSLSALFVFNMGMIRTMASDYWVMLKTMTGSIQESVEDMIAVDIHGKQRFVDINGGFRRLADQKMVNGTILGSNENLFLKTDVDYQFSEQEEETQCNRIKQILEHAESQGCTTLFVQRPHKYHLEKDRLPYGLKVQYDQQFDYWTDRLISEGFRVADLRTLEQANVFYRTDHHWTVESSLSAATAIIAALGLETGGYELTNYEYFTWKESFLGSEGIKVGKYYVGKDDFSVMIPKNPGHYEYYHRIDNKQTVFKKGSFEEAFIDRTILEDPSYNNKYNACLNGGYVENIIVNEEKKDGQKLLLISDSFARPMVMYLAQSFSEIRYLDPQEGRYNDSIIGYMDEYRPDVVIVMYNGPIQEV